MGCFKVNYYKKANGMCPIYDFLESLDFKMMAKTFRLIMLLEQNGNDLREPYSKYLGDGIFELRVKQGNNISRVLYFFLVGSEIVLTNGFIKKTSKTPLSELELAKKYRQDYLNRKDVCNE